MRRQSDRHSVSSDGSSASRKDEEQGQRSMPASGSRPNTSPYNPSSAYSVFLNQIGMRDSETASVGIGIIGSGASSRRRSFAAYRYMFLHAPVLVAVKLNHI